MQHIWQRFYRDTRGSVFIFMAFAIIVLVGVSGLALDFGASSMIHARMQHAADAGALAGALAPENSDDAARVQTARRYFALNYPDNYLESNVRAATVAIQASGVNVVVDTGNVMHDTALVGVLQEPRVATGAVSEVGKFGSSASQIRDVVLVMDASGSMGLPVSGGKQRIQAAREAADILIGGILCDTPNGSRLGWVDYSTAGASYDAEITRQPFTDSCATLRATLAQYRKKNLTTGGEAMEAAEVLMNAARSDRVRAVVFMTDGLHNTYRGQYYGDNAAGANAPVEAACARLKARNVLVYSIAFSEDAAASQSMKRCATDPNPDNGYYFYAPDEVTLKSAFQQITTSIKKIRITR